MHQDQKGDKAAANQHQMPGRLVRASVGSNRAYFSVRQITTRQNADKQGQTKDPIDYGWQSGSPEWAGAAS